MIELDEFIFFFFLDGIVVVIMVVETNISSTFAITVYLLSSFIYYHRKLRFTELNNVHSTQSQDLNLGLLDYNLGLHTM